MNETPILLVRQRHEAKKAGLHYDLRVVIGDKAFSWATKKEMPTSGNPILLFEQPTHTASYALSKHIVIPDGQYGAGETFLDFAQKGKAQIQDDAYHLDLNNGDRYLIKKMPEHYGDKAWLFLKKKDAEVSSKYLNKVASLYDDMVNHRAALRSEAHQMYPHNWEGEAPRSLWNKAHEMVKEDTTVDDEGNPDVPDINPYLARLMRNRHVSAGIEETYGNSVVDHADNLAHNNAGIKSFGAALAGGATGGLAGLALGRYLHNDKLGVVAGGVGAAIGAIGSAAHVYGGAKEKGLVSANAYLENKYNPYADRAKNFI